MKTYFNQLPLQLDKELAPVYMVVGNEPLQRVEAADMIRATARKRGFTERSLFFGDQDSVWGDIQASFYNVPMFAGKRLFEIMFTEGKPKAAAGRFFKSCLDALPFDTILLIRAEKVDGRLSWVRQIEKTGVFVQVYPKSLREMRVWLRERMLRTGLVAEERALDFICMRFEGNMLAAAQEVDKLALLCSNGLVRQLDVEKLIGIGSKFSVYELAAAACAGDVARALRVMYSLKVDNSPLPLVLWAMAAEVRRIAAMEHRMEKGQTSEDAIRNEWRTGQLLARAALGRKLGRRWQNMLFWCAEADKAIKGLSDEDAWNELLQLVLRIGGVPGLSRYSLAK